MPLGRFFQTNGGTKFREFGVLAEVKVDDWGVHIYNEEGYCVSMKKVYMYWANVAVKAQSLVGNPVLIETGGSAQSSSYFRDIYNNSFSTLDFDEKFEKHEETHSIISQLVWARVQKEEANYQLSVTKELYNNLQSQVEEMTAAEKKEAETATEALDAVWPQWEADKNKRFMIVGASYNNKPKPEKPDKSFAMRLGINTMKMKRIDVEVVERTYRNNIIVKLPQFDNTECQVALKQGNRQNTRGEWCIVSVTNTLKGWEKLEAQEYPDWKTSRKDIDWYLNAHKAILWKLL